MYVVCSPSGLLRCLHGELMYVACTLLLAFRFSRCWKQIQVGKFKLTTKHEYFKYKYTHVLQASAGWLVYSYR